MTEIRWRVLTVGHLSRNKFWGESIDHAYRETLCTSTLIQIGDRNIVVDPSCPPDEMERVLDQRAGIKPEAIDTVFLTHFHGDHYVGLTTFPHAAWYMAAPEIAAWTEQTAPDAPERALLARIKPAPAEVVPGVALLATPGHTPNHTSLIFSSADWRVVIAGDAVMTYDYFQARDVHYNTVDRAAAVRSIDTIAELADVVVPGHDNYFLHHRGAEQEAKDKHD